VSGSSPSLLSFLDAPILVGDPEGCAAFANPAFERDFGVSSEAAAGRPLALLFEGGAREALLTAVAEACRSGQTARFRLRHGAAGYTAVASPIVADDARVGVVILFIESPTADERFLAMHREMRQPLDELASSLELLLEQTGGRRSERYRGILEEGIRALARIQKRFEEIHGLLVGQPESRKSPATLDPVQVVRRAVQRVAEEYERAGVELQVLVPASLPAARGDGERLEAALVRLLKARVGSALDNETVTLAARSVGRGSPSSVVISIVDAQSGNLASLPDPAEPDRRLVGALVAEIGAELRTTADPFAGRTTAIRLELA
jgi:PAS domain-containing protein